MTVVERPSFISKSNLCHFVYITVVDVTTIDYRLLGPGSLVCVYVNISVCLSVCPVYLFSVSVIVLSTVVSCSIGGQL